MPTNILVPELGESVVEATVGEWLKQEGDPVAAGDPLVRLETDKVDLEISAERSGVLGHIERPAGTDVKIGDMLGTIEEGAAMARPISAQPAAGRELPAARAPEQPAYGGAPKSAQEDAPTQVTPSADEKVTPVARRVAQDLGVDLARVSGSGPQGRVTRQDVESYAQQTRAVVGAQPGVVPLPIGRPEPVREERVHMSRRRQTIARRLVEAQHTAAMLTTFNEIDMSKVMEIRARRKESFKERHGIGLGFMSFFVKASVAALKSFPLLNAEIQADEIILRHYHDIGIAVGAAEGLVVPVLRDAGSMSFAEIEKTIKDYVRKVEDGTLSLEDLRGGTFTITNGGVFGSLLSTPILNLPQVGILGLHKIEDRPIASGGQVVIRPMMYVALSYDHRIVDGREAVQFLVRVKELIEDPETLLLDG